MLVFKKKINFINLLFGFFTFYCRILLKCIILVNRFFLFGLFIKKKKLNLFLSIKCYKFKSFLISKQKSLKKKLVNKFSKLKIETIIFKSLKIPTIVFIKDVFLLINVKQRLRIPEEAAIWRNWRLFFFEDFINIIFFSIYFRQSNILATFISKNITNKKAHFNFVKKIKRLLNNFFFYGEYCNLVGILIKVHGKFQGKLRKRRFKYSYGRTGTARLTTYVDYSLQKSYTRFGVFSIKVCLYYAKLEG